MHPLLSADLAAAHMADLTRAAAATCCSRIVRHPLLERIRAAVHRADTGTTRACCPA